MYLPAYSAFICRSLIFLDRSMLNLNTDTGLPSTADLEVLIKFSTLIPGTSIGDWNDIKIPLLALSSAAISVTSSPSKKIFPDVISYLGLLIIVLTKVDLPEPFGPMITCVSPFFITRLTFFSISFSPTLALRSFISNNISLILSTSLSHQLNYFIISNSVNIHRLSPENFSFEILYKTILLCLPKKINNLD